MLKYIEVIKLKERIGTYLPTELTKKLREYSDKTMIPMTKIIEKAIVTVIVFG